MMDQEENPVPTTQGIIRQKAGFIGLYDPYRDAGEKERSVGLALLLMICAVLGLLLLTMTFLKLGFGVALTSCLVAFVPAVIYLSIFLWLDRFDPEPPSTLSFAFAWGATIAIFFSGIINDIFGKAWGETLTGLVTAPVIEEVCKGLGVFLIAIVFRRDFDSIVDGIVYAGVVALGFATVENIEYYGWSLSSGGMGGLAGTFFIRGIMAPFSHVLFTSMTGIGCGIARESHRTAMKLAAPVIGFSCAMLLHGLWNALASYGSETFIAGYFFLEMPLFIGLIFLIAYLVGREGRILKQTLAIEVEKGLITQEQLEIAISLFRRTFWVASALGDTPLFDSRRRFLRAVAKLGMCHWHKERANVAMKDTGSFPLISRFQSEVFLLREKV